MDYNQKSTRPVDLVFGEAQSGNLNNKDVPTRDRDLSHGCKSVYFCERFVLMYNIVYWSYF